MDPDETWRQLKEAINEGDFDRADELFDALDDWLVKGGFVPTAWRDA
jgi:hypothetical protein